MHGPKATFIPLIYGKILFTYILKLCFKKLKEISRIFQIWVKLLCSTFEICKIDWKLRIKQTQVLFCKYLRNESSDLHEISYGGQLLSLSLSFKFHGDSCINACTQVVNVPAHVLLWVGMLTKILHPHLFTDLYEI